jgi:hypothetical protein
MYYPKSEYKFIKYMVSDRPLKKYYAILENKKTKKQVKIYFGGIKPDGTPYEQYKDNVLGFYSKYDHLDKARRQRYITRHNNDINKAYSPSWFSLKYLW